MRIHLRLRYLRRQPWGKSCKRLSWSERGGRRGGRKKEDQHETGTESCDLVAFPSQNLKHAIADFAQLPPYRHRTLISRRDHRPDCHGGTPCPWPELRSLVRRSRWPWRLCRRFQPPSPATAGRRGFDGPSPCSKKESMRHGLRPSPLKIKKMRRHRER